MPDDTRRESRDAVATTYLVNRGAQPHDWVTVELTCFAGEGPHKPPTDTWAVRQRGWTLNRDGEWEYEPQPSSRDAEFYARCRYTLDEALERAREAVRDA